MTNDAYCFLWHEAEGKVTANEFATILYNLIKSNLSEGEEIILYSDGCTAQNKNVTWQNKNVTLLNLAINKDIVVTHRWGVTAYTPQLSEESAIEKSTPLLGILLLANQLA